MSNPKREAATGSLQPAGHAFGARILALADVLAEWTETPGALTCTYLTPSHRAVASLLADWMRAAGMTAEIDAAANVVGRYPAADPDARTLIVGSHYDTVRNAGKYDGRLGILAGLVVVEHLNRLGRRLPFNLELIAFSEEEGVRFSKPFIGSSAVAGRFDLAMLEARDAAGFQLGPLMREMGLDPEAIPTLARDPQRLIGYLEIHIEQGPVLLEQDLPVGVGSAIAGAVRYSVTVTGQAGHAGTVPMGQRHDAATAAAEMVLAVERRCAGTPTLVGTVGRLTVPQGAVNVIPGRCEFSLDIRAADNATRDAAAADIFAGIEAIARRRCVKVEWQETMRAAAVPCAPRLCQALVEAIAVAGIRPFELPSGAGHDAMMFSGVTDIGMLFVRCGNDGVSHNPQETVTAADADVAARVMLDTLARLGEA